MTSNGVFNENKIKEMTREPKFPHGLKWGDRTAARVDEVGYLIGIRVVGYTCLKDMIIAEVHESVADEVNAWSRPDEELKEPIWRRRVYEEAASRGILQVYKA